MTTSRLVLTMIVVTSLTMSIACHRGAPQDTLGAYARTLDKDDSDAAYALLSEDFKGRVSREKFAERHAAQAEASDEVVAALGVASGEAAFVDARLPYNEFDVLGMSLAQDGWRIDSGLFNFYGQRTPREALYSFVKAVERRKYEVLVRFVPSTYVQYTTPETIQAQFEGNTARIDEMTALLRQNKDGLIEEQGRRASMDYGPYRIDFVKEDGVWKIEDPD